MAMILFKVQDLFIKYQKRCGGGGKGAQPSENVYGIVP